MGDEGLVGGYLSSMRRGQMSFLGTYCQADGKNEVFFKRITGWAVGECKFAT